MSKPGGHFNNPSSISGDHETHFNLDQNDQVSDNMWRDDEHGSSLGRSHPAGGHGVLNVNTEPAHVTHEAPHARRSSGDRTLYTERVTKEYDAQGNVIKTSVQHPKPRTLDALDDDSGSGARGRREPMDSDDYGRTGSTRVGNEAQRNVTSATREKTGSQQANVKPSVGDKTTGAGHGQKGMGGEGTGGRCAYDPIP